MSRMIVRADRVCMADRVILGRATGTVGQEIVSLSTHWVSGAVIIRTRRRGEFQLMPHEHIAVDRPDDDN